MTMVEGVLKFASPTEVAQRWTVFPLTEPISRGTPIDKRGNRSIVGEMLAAAGNRTPWIRLLNPETATILAAKSLGIPRLHVNLVKEVVNDFIVNRHHRSGELKEIATTALLHPEMYLGPHTPLILTFGRLLDSYTLEQLRDIHLNAPGSSGDEFDKAKTRALRDSNEPGYTFGYHSGQAAARLALICTIYQPRRPTTVELNNVDKLAGLAVNEIQTFGAASGKPRLYFLSHFFNDQGRRLTLNWLRNHPA